MTESTMTETRHQVERWIEESQYLLGRVIPSVFDDHQRLRDRLAASEADADRLRQEVAALRREIHDLQSELGALRAQYEQVRGDQHAVAEALGRAIHHFTQMMQPLNEMAARLQVGQATLETAYQ
jgi:chromosome segregation ATPase